MAPLRALIPDLAARMYKFDVARLTAPA